MTATVTAFRKDLFRMADQAINGAVVQFTYKGVVFEVKPEKKLSKLEKLVGQPVLAEATSLEESSQTLLTQMQAEWAQDWSELA